MNYKKIRSDLLFKILGDVPVVVYTCGNSAIELKKSGFTDVLDIGDKGTYQPNNWHYSYFIKKLFPNRIDLTSGHLPVDLCYLLGKEYSNQLSELPSVVPSGSGETVLSLALANPERSFKAEFNNDFPHTTLNEENKITALLIAMVNITVLVK